MEMKRDGPSAPRGSVGSGELALAGTIALALFNPRVIVLECFEWISRFLSVCERKVT